MHDRVTPDGARISGPDAEGFVTWQAGGEGYNAGFGPIRARPEGESMARVRFETGPSRANPIGALHGGFLLACLDQALFVGPVALGRLTIGKAVTLNVATQFIGTGRIDRPLDAVVEISHETGRLLFLRGQMEQEGALVLAFQATLRKLADRPG